MDSELEALSRKPESQYFYNEYIKREDEKYVAWIDLMGIRDHLKNRQVYPAVLRGELLSVISENIDRSKAEMFTAGDGSIIITDEKDYLYDFLSALFSHYTKFNVKNWKGGEDIWLNRLLRAGVGHGEIHRIDIEKYDSSKRGGSPFSEEFANDPFGPGIIDALRAERGSPYSIHRYNDDGTISGLEWWGYMGLGYDERTDIIEMLDEYFSWYSGRHDYQYSPYDRNHLNKAINYFEVDPKDLDT